MFNPYFNTPDNYHKYAQDLLVANGYCLNCNAPLRIRHTLCGKCMKTGLFYDGFEDSRVKIGSVGRDTINYQQYLHRSIFDCNVHFKYRGTKEERIKARVSKKAMNKATIRLNTALSSVKYTYNEVQYHNNKHNRKIYNSVKDVRNIQERLIYNVLLYYIAYHIDNNIQFKSFVHFQVSMMHNLLINVENTHIRIHRPENFKYFNQRRKNNTAKYWYWLFKEIDSIVNPLMNEIIESITKKGC